MLLYYPQFLASDEADELFAVLRDRTAWAGDRVVRPAVPAADGVYADDGVVYRYSGVAHAAVSWPDYLRPVRQRRGDGRGGVNSLLLNYYRDGRDSIGYHADDEPELGVNPVVPSLSLGATRRFLLRHTRTGERLAFDLPHGSLLIMAGTVQHHYRHAVPKTTRPVGRASI
ncbi:MAG: alpha-ketoglutarate-dependent dioxygenase AlkB [Gemmataceae bacterium]